MKLSFHSTLYALRGGAVVSPEPHPHGDTLYCTFSVLEERPHRGLWEWLRGEPKLQPQWEKVSVRGTNTLPDKMYLGGSEAKRALDTCGDPASTLYTYHCRAAGVTKWHLITVGSRARKVTRESMQEAISTLE